MTGYHIDKEKCFVSWISGSWWHSSTTFLSFLCERQWIYLAVLQCSNQIP